MAGDFERRAAERGAHVIGQIVIARQAQHRNLGRAEQMPDPAIAFGVVLHEVARQQDAVRAAAAALPVGNCRLQCRQRRHAAQAAGGIAEQVHIGVLDETDGLHSR
jgi:deoxyxylulose-5-phosphate synthase